MIDWERVARTKLHPIQIRVLETLSDGQAIKSPVELAGEFDEPLGNVSYHVSVLRKLDLVELVATTPRRGALEHHYQIVRNDG